MNRTNRSTADELERYKKPICFIFDTSSFLQEEYAETVLYCLETLRRAASYDAGIIPTAVSEELHGQLNNPQLEIMVSALLDGPLKDLPSLPAMTNSWKNPTEEKPAVALCHQGKQHTWDKMERFARNKDAEILSCACYFFNHLQFISSPSSFSTATKTYSMLPHIGKVVLVTQDQVMALKATATYHIPTISCEFLEKVMCRRM